MLLFLLFTSFYMNAQESTVEYQVHFGEVPGGHPMVSDVFEPEHQGELPFIGVSAYTAGRDVPVQLHYRVLSDGDWSEWQAFKLSHEGQSGDRTAFEGPPISPPMEAIQFKADQKIESVVVFRLYFPNTEKKNAVGSGNKSSADCNCPQPSYCDRDCWCPSGNCPKDATPEFTTPTHLIVHHSAGFNTSSDFAAVVAYYWDLHVNTNGWDDIGYNWLIDPNGVVYEGRGSGAQGAHFSCMNGGTVGICMIGDFRDQPPTQAAIAQLEDWLAWEACSESITADGRDLHQASQLELHHISGHLDGNSATAPGACPKGTVCPGGQLYDMLPALRNDVAGKSCLVGIKDFDHTSNALRVYPNPTNGAIQVQLLTGHLANKSWTVSLTDMVGKRVYEQKIEMHNDRLLLNPGNSGISSGWYLIQVQQEALTYRTRLLIE